MTTQRGQYNSIQVKNALQVDGTTVLTGATTITGALTQTGALSIDDTTTSTSGTTGSIHTDGGLGVAGTLYVGSTITVAGVVSNPTDHLTLNATTDTKTIKLNSRNSAATSGDIIGYQSKIAASTTGSATVYGSQISPRFAHGAGGAALIGIQSNPILKGTASAGGNLTGTIRAVEGLLESESGGVRTVTGAIAAFSAQSNLWANITASAGVWPFYVGAAGNNLAWSGLMLLPAGGGVTVVTGGTYTTAEGYIVIKVGANTYQVPFFTAADGG